LPNASSISSGRFHNGFDFVRGDCAAAAVNTAADASQPSKIRAAGG
jgi:hypothetical protein